MYFTLDNICVCSGGSFMKIELTVEACDTVRFRIYLRRVCVSNWCCGVYCMEKIIMCCCCVVDVARVLVILNEIIL